MSRGLQVPRDLLDRIKRIERQLRDPRSANTAWGALGLAAGWAIFSGTADVMVTGEGTVRLRGSLTPAASGSTVCTIPPGYTPENTTRVPLAAQGAANAFAQITAAGVMTIVYTGTPTWIALDGASWRSFTPSSAPFRP